MIFGKASLAALLSSGVALAAVGCDSGQNSSDPPDTGNAATGCKVLGARPATAPNGYYVNGNTVCSPEGEAHLLHGVDRPSLEWTPEGEYLSAADFAAMATWHANVVRVALNQDFWLSDSPVFSAGYPALVDHVVTWAHAAGLDVILDLHWSDKGDYHVDKGPAQQVMADVHSVAFWKEVAARYKDDGRVFFELYNEPHDIPAGVWLSGGTADGFAAVGMQTLYDTVRAAGANNLVIVGGVDYAFDLSVVQSGAVKGFNILYATHPYDTPERQPNTWSMAFGYLAATDAVIATEFGDGNTGSCTADYDKALIAYADAHHMSWTSWAWFTGGCDFPALLTDFTYDTTGQGAAVKAALLGYHDPAAPPADAGVPETGADGG